MVIVAPYGSWRSPVTSQMLVERAVGLSQVVVDGDEVYWNEARPAEAGRQVIVRRAASGGTSPVDVLPEGFSARTLAHEYGGQAYAVRAGTVYFSNFSDQRLWRIVGGAAPEPLTGEPESARSVRFADPVVTPDGRWVICVRERHLGETSLDVVNDVVAVATDGSGSVEVLAEGHDFFSAPRVSPDGTRLAWLSWDPPNMPWDGTELWVARLDGTVVTDPQLVAGGQEESVTQPRWS